MDTTSLCLSDKSKKISKFSEHSPGQAAVPANPKKRLQCRKKRPSSPKESSFYTDEDYSQEGDNLSEDDMAPAPPVRSRSKVETHSGRPFKPQVDIDDISKEEGYFQDAQSKFFFFMGDRLHSIPGLEEKPSLKKVYEGIRLNYESFPLVFLNDFDIALQNLLTAYDQKHFEVSELARLRGRELEYILGFYLLWLGRYVVNQKFLKDFTKLIILIYHSIKQHNLKADNIVDDSLKLMINMAAPNFDYEFAKPLKLGKQDCAGYLKDMINLTCNLIHHALNL